MKEAIIVDLNGEITDVTIVADTFVGVAPFYADSPAPDKRKKPEPTGYIVGVPVPQGLYLPRFNQAAWQTYRDDTTAEQPELWTEGLTPEEIEVLHPPAEPTELERLQAENTELKLAIAELAEANEADKTAVQLALAELAALFAS